MTLRVAQRALDVPNGDAVLLRLRDADLDAWTDRSSPVRLREQVDLALTVGPLQPALTWRPILRGVHPADAPNGRTPSWGAAESLEPGTLREV